MSSGSCCELSWLCLEIDGSLRPYLQESEALGSLTEEKENELLVSLSQLLRKIQIGLRTIDSSSDTDTPVKPTLNDELSSDGSRNGNHCSEVDQCLPKIVANVIAFLTVKSRFIQHLASNLLVSISEFVSITDNCWDKYIQLLCLCMELAITTIFSNLSTPSNGAENLNLNSSDGEFCIRKRLTNCDWSTVGGINKALCSIFKHLKDERDGNLFKVYCDSVNSCFLNVCWDLLEGNQAGGIGHIEKNICVDALYPRNIYVRENPGIIFLGTFVQLLCSMVDQKGFVDDAGSYVHKHPILIQIINIVPKLMGWCLGKHSDGIDMGITQYFRHKLLILLTRLSFSTYIGCSILLSWLQLLHNYFHGLLRQPLLQFHSSQDYCLDDSPFLSTLSDGEVSRIDNDVFCSNHHQRLVLFLFLKFSLTLIRVDNEDRCICSNSNSCLIYDANSFCDRSCKKKGLLQLYNWLQEHFPTDISMDHEKYLGICLKFASSFLQLFLQEDDLLFQLLLQLLCVPAPHARKELHKGVAASQDAFEEVSCLVSYLFNPLLLFNLFLLQIHYDYQVLLDYLISKDTGISCATYLLRCLRLVCDSWDELMEFLVCGQLINQSSSEEGTSSSDHKTQAFEEAKECLLLLETAIEKLHLRDLFPYNPEVLLKRLRRFQELCKRVESSQTVKA